MYNILLIEDDRPLNKAISVYFKKEKFHVLSCFSGQEALDTFSQNNSDLIILDINLPDLSGFDLIEQIKIINSNIPILILSACDLDSAILHGFNLGAEDYVTKPFTPLELLARVNSQLRRYRRFMEKLGDKEKTQNIHVIGGLELDEERVEVRVDGELVKVTPMEYKILLLLMKNPGRVFSADEIYERVWNERAVNTDTIMVHVRNIREKIEINPKEPKYLKVVWGVGYKIEKQA